MKLRELTELTIVSPTIAKKRFFQPLCFSRKESLNCFLFVFWVRFCGGKNYNENLLTFIFLFLGAEVKEKKWSRCIRWIMGGGAEHPAWWQWLHSTPAGGHGRIAPRLVVMVECTPAGGHGSIAPRLVAMVS